MLAVSYAGSAEIFGAVASTVLAGGKWLTVSPTGAATPAQLTVTASAKGLSAGVYSGAITLSVNGVANSVTTVPVSFSIQAPAVSPVIAAGGVINAASATPAIAPGAWVSIFGTNLSATTRPWSSADFVNNVLPLSLDGVGVTIDGKSAPVSFISPTQINVLAPSDATTGLVPVQVKNSLGTSVAVYALQQTIAPAFFQFSGTNYVAATHADYSDIAGPALVKLGVPGTPAKPGEVIVLYGTGFGATQPPISATAPVSTPLPLAADPASLSVHIGGLNATIAYAGLVGPGLYQFNVVVPQPLPNGDASVTAQMQGLITQANLLLTVQN
jgi:uncharacterized protein (TIGR03437 family)